MAPRRRWREQLAFEMKFGGGLRFLLIGVVIGFVLGQGYTLTDVIESAGTLWRIITGKEGKGNTSPTAHLIHPDEGEIFRHDEEIVLKGMGIDAEDGELGDKALTWTLDGGGKIKPGRESDIPVEERLYKWQELELTATDRAGAQGTRDDFDLHRPTAARTLAGRRRLA